MPSDAVWQMAHGTGEKKKGETKQRTEHTLVLSVGQRIPSNKNRAHNINFCLISISWTIFFTHFVLCGPGGGMLWATQFLAASTSPQR